MTIRLIACRNVPTIFQRSSNPLPTGCVFVPPTTPQAEEGVPLASPWVTTVMWDRFRAAYESVTATFSRLGE